MDMQQQPAISIPRGGNASGAIMAMKIEGPNYLIITGQVKISLKDGSMQFEPGYSPDQAARQFWEAMSQDYRDMLKWKAEHK